jgi:hypothetical protein
MVPGNGLRATTGFTISRRSKVTETEARLLAHEAVCAERYASTNARLKRIEQILIGSAAFIVASLVAIALKMN